MFYDFLLSDPDPRSDQKGSDPTGSGSNSTKYIKKNIMHKYNTVYMRTGKRRGLGLATHDRLLKRVGFGYS